MANKRRKLSLDERVQLHNKFDGHCAYCGCKISLKEMTSDHVKPLEKGGADTVDNLFPACFTCNHYKNRYTVEQFRRKLREAPEIYRDEEIVKRYGVSRETKIIFFYERGIK